MDYWLRLQKASIASLLNGSSKRFCAGQKIYKLVFLAASNLVALTQLKINFRAAQLGLKYVLFQRVHGGLAKGLN